MTLTSLKTFAWAAIAALTAGTALAQETPVTIAISGWTGFAPLTLAREAGLFKKHGLNVTIKKIPQKDRHLAIASGDVQCAATTVETWIAWNAAGVATTQIFQLDKSFGADGMVVKPAIRTIAGNTDIDGGMTYEPFLSAVRAKPEAGKIIATTLDYPMIMDTFGCTPKFLADNAKAAQGLTNGYFDALEMIQKSPKQSFEIMGADVKQSAEAFEASQKYLRWQDRAANQKFFAGEHLAFSKEAASLLLVAGIIKQIPDLSKLADTRFIK